MGYTTILDEYRERMAYHLGRAEIWRARGLPEYAAGSEKKASRWRKRMEDWTMLTTLSPWVQEVVDKLAAGIAKSIFYGRA